MAYTQASIKAPCSKFGTGLKLFQPDRFKKGQNPGCPGCITFMIKYFQVKQYLIFKKLFYETCLLHYIKRCMPCPQVSLLYLFIFVDDLVSDYQFTFNLSKREDKFYTQINFMNIPSAVSYCYILYRHTHILALSFSLQFSSPIYRIRVWGYVITVTFALKLMISAGFNFHQFISLIINFSSIHSLLLKH